MTDTIAHKDVSISAPTAHTSQAEASLVSPHAQYRSKVFSVNHSVNPLVASAASIFSIVNQCCQQVKPLNQTQLSHELSHEIQAFECQAQQHAYPEQTILAARYALCAYVDESIEHRCQQHDQEWQAPSLLKLFHSDNSGGEQFYRLLERSQANPAAFIDLLELYYLCLALGFQGKYGRNEQGYIIRENIVNKLYNSIRQERGDFSKNVLVGAETAKATVTPVRKTYKGIIAISLAAIAITATLVMHQYHQLQVQDQSIQQVMMKMLQTQP